MWSAMREKIERLRTGLYLPRGAGLLSSVTEIIEGRGPNARRYWYDSVTGKKIPAIGGGGIQGWEETLDNNGGASGSATTSNTSEQLLISDFNIPAYYMGVGKTLRITLWGLVNNTAATSTVTFRVRWGGLAGTLLLSTGALNMDSSNARTNASFFGVAYIMCQTIGASGTFMCGGFCAPANLLQTAANEFLGNGQWGSAGNPLASANSAVTVATNSANLLSVTVQYGTVANAATCQARIIEAMN